MKIQFYAGTQEHYAWHLIPLYLSLPAQYRGDFYALGLAGDAGREAGIPVLKSRRFGKDELVAVAGYQEYRTVHPARVIFVNHGAGQTYSHFGKTRNIAERNPSYSGGRNRERAVLYICPSRRDAEINLEHYPQARAVAAGVPYLDPFHHGWPRCIPPKPVVAISFHADIYVAPESRSAFAHYDLAIRHLVRSNEYEFLGHGHPRLRPKMQKFWSSLGVKYEPDWRRVLARASLYVCDNSSTIFEFASTDRPVVVLDAPWYRRDAHHGLRFWSHADIGVRISEPDDLEVAIKQALIDPPEVRSRRDQLVADVYDGVQFDGKATSRAVNAMIEVCEELGG